MNHNPNPEPDPSLNKPRVDENALREGLHKRAREQTLATLPAFLTECANVEAGYGECVVATGAAMLATFYAMNNSAPTCRGGMTGFQAGAATWEIIKAIGVLGGEDSILAFFDHADLLYPQRDHKRTTIPAHVWDEVKRRAIQNLTCEDLANVARPVVDRWREIAQGRVPSPFTVEERKGGAS